METKEEGHWHFDDGHYDYISCKLDKVVMYNRALSNIEIKMLYYGEVPPGGFIGLWVGG
jgi:hypothetical protein